jgi:L-asparaginase/Glu-tRNA(Gln) amidotransferase subunit D
LIKAEPYGEDPRVIVITRGGTITGDARMTQGKTTKDSRIRKVVEKTQTFDAKKERQIFEEERKEFKGDQGSSSKTRPEVIEYGMP